MIDPQQREKMLDARLTVARIDEEVRQILKAERTPPREPLRALSVAELMDRRTPGYLIDAWLPEGGLCQVVGPPETLKSFFVCHAGLAIASRQRDFFGHAVVKHGAVLYIAAEGSGLFQNRVLAWCHEHNVDALAVPFRVIPLPVDLRDSSFQEELLEVVAELKPVLIVIDTLARCTPGADENSAREMGEAVSFCTALQAAVGSAVVLVHHPTKADPRGGGRGSGAILGAIDTEIRTTASGEAQPDGTRLIQITCSKQKDDLKPAPLDLVGYVVPVRDLKGREMAHESGRPMTTLLLRLATEQDARSSAQATAATLEQLIVSFLKATPCKTKKEIAKGINRQAGAVGDKVDELKRNGVIEETKEKVGRAVRAVYSVTPQLLLEQSDAL